MNLFVGDDSMQGHSEDNKGENGTGHTERRSDLHTR